LLPQDIIKNYQFADTAIEQRRPAFDASSSTLVLGARNLRCRKFRVSSCRPKATCRSLTSSYPFPIHCWRSLAPGFPPQRSMKVANRCPPCQ